MKNCNCHYEIPRDGSGQLCRYLKALDPAYAPVDGRSIEDLLVFAKRYAAQIRFYDIPESKIGDPIAPEKVSWREFFRRDMAVIAASISVVDTAKLKLDYDQNREHLEAHPNANALHGLFDPILGMIAQIDRWYAIAIPENPLHSDLDLAINSTLREQVKKIVAYEEAYKTVDQKHPLKLDFSAIENKSLWGLDKEISPDDSIYQGISLDDKIRTAALYIDDIFHAFYGFVVDLVKVKSLVYMQFALEAYPAHQPHMALFITFLELFRLAQDQMNGLTERMLNFYYKDVLRLAPKPSIADRVHIVFELAKDIADYDLAQGTALKAGKDAAGKEQIYATESDLVINQAKVKELKSVFIQKTPSPTDSKKGTIDAIFARPIANSLDGFGEKITDPSGKWSTFGKGIPKQKANNICQKIEQYKEIVSRKDQAKIGFAVASPQLLLQGGNRLIKWEIQGLKEIIPANFDTLKIGLTGEKGWLEIGDLGSNLKFIDAVTETGIFEGNSLPDASGYHFDKDNSCLYLYLPIAEQAVIPFNAKLHTGYLYITDFPIAQVLIGAELGIDSDKFKALSFANQKISVWVGSMTPANNDGAPTLYFDGLKTLVLQNETGLLDANKPFDPFTLYPNSGKFFYIGSAEVFNKPLESLAVDLKYTQDNGDNYSPPRFISYDASLLSNKQWLTIKTGGDRLDLAGNIIAELPHKPDRTPIEPVTEWKSQTTKGFIAIELRFSTAGHIPNITVGGTTLGVEAAVNEVITLLPIASRQELASYLQIKEVSLSYTSTLSQLNPKIDQFFHVYPFGVTEIYIGGRTKRQLQLANQSSSTSVKTISAIKLENAFIDLSPTNIGIWTTYQKEFDSLDAQKNQLLIDANRILLPQFTYRNPNEDVNTASQLELSSSKDVNLSRSNVMDLFVVEASGIRQSILGGNNQYSGDLQEEGMLFIGLEKLRPLDTLSLLFQFAEGSAVDEDHEPPPQIHWSYLTNNEWRSLKGEDLIADGTYGFQATGIVKISVPEDSTDHNTIITDGLRWFCASVTEYSERIPMLVNVVAQAVEARFQDNSNSPSHFDKALPAGSIGKLAVAVAQVGKVAQPFASFDGKHQEIGKEFYTRVSERLRHKARAITPWDYEHLVLDRFPSIYKVKCITHTDPACLCRPPIDSVERDSKGCCGSQIAPGHILIVPISNLKNRNAANPLQPKTGRRTLLEIQNYLGKLTSPFVKVHAKNPVYEQVLVFFRVQFIAGKDKGYHLKKLNDELVHYLTPWAFDENADVSFAQKIYASAIINFIEEREYVDFITDFFMFVCRDECCPVPPASAGVETRLERDAADILEHISGCCDMEELIANSDFIGEVIAEPSTPRSILVSAPKHIIIPYEAPIEISLCEQRKQAQSAVAADVNAKKAIDEAVIIASEENVSPSSAITEAPPTTRNKKNK